VAETIAIEYQDLFEFLEDYRANLSQLQYTVQTEGPPAVGDYYDLEIGLPVLGDTARVRGRVMAPMGANMAGLQLEANEGEFAKLQGFYALVGRLVEEMLRSGRFLIAGQVAAGAAPPAGFAAPPSAAGMPAAPAAAAAARSPASHSGEVSPKALTELFMRLYNERSTGILEFRGEGGSRKAFFKNGGIVAWRNDPLREDECLGVLLTRAGRITEAQLKESLQMMNDTGTKQGECLIEMGVLTFPQVIMSLMTQSEIVTRNVFSDETGTWEFFPLKVLPEAFVQPPIKLPGFLFGWYKKFYAAESVEKLEARAEPLMDFYVRVKDWNWDDFRFKKTERAFVEILSKKVYRYREIQSVSNVGRGGTVNMLNSLMEMGAFEFESSEDTDQVDRRHMAELENKQMHQRGQNPFEMLEVHWTCRTDDVKDAYERLHAEYVNFGRGAKLGPEAEAIRQEILGNIETAYRSVAETKVRQETRKKFFEPQQHDFSADLMARQADMLMVRNAWPQVIENLERAIELMPNVGSYRQMLKNAKARAGGYRPSDGDS